MTKKPKKLSDLSVTLKHTKFTRRRGKLGVLFIGKDDATGKEVRWWVKMNW